MASIVIGGPVFIDYLPAECGYFQILDQIHRCIDDLYGVLFLCEGSDMASVGYPGLRRRFCCFHRNVSLRCNISCDHWNYVHAERDWIASRQGQIKADVILPPATNYFSVRGYCEVCDKLILSTWAEPVRVHKPCGQFKGAGLLPPKEPTSGRPRELETARKHFAWLVLKVIGQWGQKKIAAHFGGLDKKTVAEGIESILSQMPEPELVPARFQPIVRALRGLNPHLDERE